MKPFTSYDCWPTRRSFLKTTAAFAAGFSGINLFAQPSTAAPPDEWETIVGPKKGYSPQIGTLVSEMAFMRGQVLHSVKGMSQNDLDFLLDDKANRIGALLVHLAAVESFYQFNTFQGLAPDKLPASFKEKWGTASELGEPARKAIKGNNLDYYLNILKETREATLAEFRKRDDEIGRAHV